MPPIFHLRNYFCRFTDKKCSGLKSCDFQVNDMVHYGVRPCPLELSSYLEASYKCLQSNMFKTYCYFVNLHSFADARCSGKLECEMEVARLVYHTSPCPRELSSYLQAGYTCVSGRVSTILHEFAKLSKIPFYSSYSKSDGQGMFG